MQRFAAFALLLVGMIVNLEVAAHGAHEHGIAQLQVAVSDRTLEMHLESPAMNIVGFEHQPKNDAERALIKKSVADLKNPALFTFDPATACTLGQADVTSDLLGQPTVEAGASDTAETHADMDVTYQFACTTAPKTVQVLLMTRFAGIESVRVQVVTDSAQRSLTLDKANATIPL